MILMIDNYDSFTFNLVQYLSELGQKLVVRRHDEITVDGIARMRPDCLVISPGPGSPDDAGVSCDAIRAFGGKIPILGVCLGHQAIGQVYGGRVIHAGRIMHGKTSLVHHAGHPLFKGLDNPFVATRYHSLLVEKRSLPKCLEIIAWTKEGEIMGLAHKEFLVWGVQFHPESILTVQGKELLANFTRAIGARR